MVSRGLVGRPDSPFKTARDELVRMGIVDGSIEMRLAAGLREGIDASVLELTVRWAIPASMKRLFRDPSGSWPVVVGGGRVVGVVESRRTGCDGLCLYASILSDSLSRGCVGTAADMQPRR